MRSILVVLLLAQASTAEVFRVEDVRLDGAIEVTALDHLNPIPIGFLADDLRLSMTYALNGREMTISTLEIGAATFAQQDTPFPLSPVQVDLNMRNVWLNITAPVTTGRGNELFVPFQLSGNFEGQPFETIVEGEPPLSYLKIDVDESTIVMAASQLGVSLTGDYELYSVGAIGSGQYAPVATLAGDADHDGRVAISDFGILRNNFGKAGGWEMGDFDFDGQVRFPDFLILSSNFGQAAAAAVPEPSTGLLLLSACLGGYVILHRKGHRHEKTDRDRFVAEWHRACRNVDS